MPVILQKQNGYTCKSQRNLRFTSRYDDGGGCKSFHVRVTRMSNLSVRSLTIRKHPNKRRVEIHNTSTHAQLSRTF